MYPTTQMFPRLQNALTILFLIAKMCHKPQSATHTKFHIAKRYQSRFATRSTRKSAMTYPTRYPSRKKSLIVSGLNTGATMILPNANLLNSTTTSNINLKCATK